MSYLGLRFHLQVQWEESKEDFHCSYWSCSHCSLILKQAILCSLLCSVWLLLSLTLGHHIVAG
jgi:hypothetical protein